MHRGLDIYRRFRVYATNAIVETKIYMKIISFQINQSDFSFAKLLSSSEL